MCEDHAGCIERDVEDRILSLAGGHEPRTLSDWIHIAGRLGVAVMSWPEPGFSGGMAGSNILLPPAADDFRCVGVMAHEIAEHLGREKSHKIGRWAERRFVWNEDRTEERGEEFTEETPRTRKAPEKLLPRRGSA